MSQMLIDDLKKQIKDHKILAVIGTGVSVSATNNPIASWSGLLASGIDYCQALDTAGTLPEGWAERVRADLRSGDMDDVLAAAEKVSRKLRGFSDGEFRRWLHETVGSLRIVNRDVLEAVRDLDLLLLTTNYDDLLETVTGYQPVTWRNPSLFKRVLNGDEEGILHLHGYWKDPASIILGIRDYDTILKDEAAQAILQALRVTRSLLFIGCADGLSDPNLGELLKWYGRLFPDDEYRSFILARHEEVARLQRERPAEQRTFVLDYGPNFPDLAPFLRQLAPPQHRPHLKPTVSLSLDAELLGSEGELFSIAFSTDGRYVAAGGEEQILLWDLEREPEEVRGGIKWFLQPIRKPIAGAAEDEDDPDSLATTNYIYSIAFSRDGRLLACGGQDGIVRLWDVRSMELVEQLRGHTRAVYSVAFSPDNTRLASGSYDEDVIIWDVTNLQFEHSLARTGKKVDRITSISFSPDNRVLAIGSWQNDITLWDIETDACRSLRGHQSSVESVAFSPDGRLLASGGLDKTVRVWDMRAQTDAPELWSKEHQYVVKCVTFSPDSRIVASASWDMTVVLREAETGNKPKSLPLPNHRRSEWHEDWIWSIAFSPQRPFGIYLATGGSDQKVMLWRLGAAR